MARCTVATQVLLKIVSLVKALHLRRNIRWKRVASEKELSDAVKSKWLKCHIFAHKPKSQKIFE